MASNKIGYCLLVLEVLFLLTASAAGLTAMISLLLSRDQISGSNCLLYGTFNWTGGPVEGDKARCDFSLFVQIVVCAVALVSAVYRCLSLVCSKLDVKCFRILSIVIYVLCTVLVLIECALVHVGVIRFCDSMKETNPDIPEDSTCQNNQDEYNDLTGDEAIFYTYLWMSALTSWISLGAWVVLTCLACFSMCVREEKYDD